MLIEAQA